MKLSHSPELERARDGRGPCFQIRVNNTRNSARLIPLIRKTDSVLRILFPPFLPSRSLELLTRYTSTTLNSHFNDATLRASSAIPLASPLPSPPSLLRSLLLSSHRNRFVRLLYVCAPRCFR